VDICRVAVGMVDGEKRNIDNDWDNKKKLRIIELQRDESLEDGKLEQYEL
jgi:hypothetical protein